MTTSSVVARRAGAAAAISLLLLTMTAQTSQGEMAPDGAEEQAKTFWRNPVDLETRDLLYGIGGKKDAPAEGPLAWEKEDLNGTSPKFIARDSHGTKWKIKVGPEAKPETAATRLVWAVGYTTDEDYFVPEAQIKGVPAATKRFRGRIDADGTIRNARFEREEKDIKKDGRWKWRSVDFAGTREWNGLRALMALLNNWDLKDVNNSVYQKKDSGRDIYLVSDLGATFGTTGRLLNGTADKGDLERYEHSRFITRKTAEYVSFATPARPQWILFASLPEYISRLRMEWIGRNVPREDAHWMGTLLARLSARQIRDAFRAGGYGPEEVEGFARVVERRIQELNAL